MCELHATPAYLKHLKPLRQETDYIQWTKSMEVTKSLEVHQKWSLIKELSGLTDHPGYKS